MSVTSTCTLTKGASGWRGAHSEVKVICSPNAIAQPSVRRSPSRTAAPVPASKGRVRSESPRSASATPAQKAGRTFRRRSQRDTTGTTSTESPVMKPERAGVVWRRPTVCSP